MSIPELIRFEHHVQQPGKAHLDLVSHSEAEVRESGMRSQKLSSVFRRHMCPVCKTKIANEYVYKVVTTTTKEKTAWLSLKTGIKGKSFKPVTLARSVSSQKSSRKRRRSNTPETPIELRASKAPKINSPSVNPQREVSSSISSSSSSSSSSVTNLPKPKDDVPFNPKKALQSFKKKMKKNYSELLERKQTELLQESSSFTEAFFTGDIEMIDYLVGTDENADTRERLEKEIELLKHFESNQYDSIDRKLLEEMIQTAETDVRRLSQKRPTKELTLKNNEVEFLKNLLVLSDPTLLN